MGLVQQDVLQLDVAVDDALAVQVAQPRQDLPEEDPGYIFLRPLAGGQHLQQAASGGAVQEKHGEDHPQLRPRI